MGKMIASLLALAGLCMCLTACSKEQTESTAETSASSAESSTQQQESAAATEKTTQPQGEALPAAERAAGLAVDKGEYVSDETGTLTKDECKSLNEIAGSFSGVSCAAVITGNLCGASPDGFAAEYFNALFGPESTGFLILVNNETGEDRVYTSGACSLYLARETIDLTLAKVTPQLVMGDYAPALEQLFQIGAMMPDTIYDHSGILSREQYDNFLALAEDGMQKTDKQYSVLLVDTRTWQTENSMQIYANVQREELGADGLLVIDVDGKICAVSGDFAGAATMTAELNAVLQDAPSLPITAAVTEYYDQVKDLS